MGLRFLFWVVIGCFDLPVAWAYELPRLTEVAVAGATSVSPGSTLTLRYRLVGGTAPLRSVAFSFSGPRGPRSVVADAMQGVATLAITNDWFNGDYQLTNVSAATMYDRSVSFQADGSATTTPSGQPVAPGVTPLLSRVRFTVTGAMDSYRAPAITALTRSAAASVAVGETSTFSAVVVAGSTRVVTVRARLRDASGRLFNLPLLGDGAGNFTGSVAPASDWLNGSTTVDRVQLVDAAGNVVTYARAGAVSDIFGASGTHGLNLPSLDFAVTGAAAAVSPPRLTQIALGGSASVRAGDEAALVFSAQAGTSELASITFTFASNLSRTLSVTTTDVASGKAWLRVPHDSTRDRYTLSEVSLVDRLGRSATYDRAGNLVTFPPAARNSHAFPFSAIALEVEAPLPGRLTNLAIRCAAGTDAETLIVGFSVGGAGTNGPKSLLVRGVGPGLAGFGVPGALRDPVLRIFSGDTSTLDNDDWAGNAAVASAAATVGAFALPAGSSDAALLLAASSATYSAQITGKDGATGIALAEIYDLSSDGAATPRLTNLSTRARVGAGGDVLIAGFAVSGGPRTVLIRAVGASLAQFGLTGTLANARLVLFAGSDPIAASDDWSGDPVLAAAFRAAGAFSLPDNSTDAALMVTLPPSGYTAQVSGVGDTTGIALVEVYEVP